MAKTNERPSKDSGKWFPWKATRGNGDKCPTETVIMIQYMLMHFATFITIKAQTWWFMSGLSMQGLQGSQADCQATLQIGGL